MANWMFVTITISLLTVVVIKKSDCKLNLRVFNNLNNVVVLLTNSTLEARSDKNLSLTCKIFDSNINDVIDDEIIWGKKGGRIKFVNNSSRPSNLDFTPVKFNNRGKYVCASLKHDLYKIIIIIVKKEYLNGFAKKKRWKRNDIDHSKLISNTLISNYFETTTVTIVDKLYPDNQQHPYDYGHNDYSNNRFYSKRKDYSYAGVITGIVAVILIIGGILYRLMKRFDILYADAPQQTVNVEPACQHPSCGQYCTLAATNNARQNNIHNLCHAVHAPTVTVNTISNSRISSPTVRLQNTDTSTDNQVSLASIADLPPSYDSSVKYFDSKYAPPPTYNEALGYTTNFNRNKM